MTGLPLRKELMKIRYRLDPLVKVHQLKLLIGRM